MMILIALDAFKVFLIGFGGSTVSGWELAGLNRSKKWSVEVVCS